MQHAMPVKGGIKALVGSGDKIMLFTLPFVVVGVVLNVLFPAFFAVGGPSTAALVVALVLLIPGVVLWLTSVILVLTRVPKGELMTSGPYALVKHPLYTSVGLLVLPAVGLLFDTWMLVPVGIILYLAARRFAREEEQALAKQFGAAWTGYTEKVVLPWL